MMNTATSSNNQPAIIQDSFGRVFRYLRLSVTDRCNLACQYCNPTDLCAPHSPDLLTWEDFEFIVQTSVEDCGLKALRITGGEPTVRPGIIDWIARISSLDGLQDISMTSNGVLLKQQAKAFAEAGLNRVNISLDTWNAEKFRILTRGGDIHRVIDGIHESTRYLQAVKINCVALKSNLYSDLPDFLEFASETGIEVRFIELMPIFDQKDYFEREFISTEDMQKEVQRLGWKLEPTSKDHGQTVEKSQTPGFGPATRFNALHQGKAAKLGFISQMSDTKCKTCNKLRITSDGSLKPCLLMPEEIPLRKIIRERNRDELIRVMSTYFLERAETYSAEIIRNESVPRKMQSIGG